MSETFEVLFVCTGNVCRSPMAQELLRHKLADRMGERATAFRITSAGTGALAGEPMTEYAAAVLSEHGVSADDAGRFIGRQLAADYVADADLVLTATREHRMEVATLVPDAVAKTFTIAEYALLLGGVDRDGLPEDDPAARARELTRRALELRGTVQPASPQDLDLADPYMLSLEVFRGVGAQLDTALTAIADTLAPMD